MLCPAGFASRGLPNDRWPEQRHVGFSTDPTARLAEFAIRGTRLANQQMQEPSDEALQ